MTREITDYQKKVYETTAQIPSGRVASYGAIAHALHSSPRAVGQALRRNPFVPSVPCHRVVSQMGDLTGFHGSATDRALDDKRTLLEAEGIVFDGDGRVPKQFFHRFPEIEINKI
jgi:methylated-DNA-[protein]-cysteine S-methyltransferase